MMSDVLQLKDDYHRLKADYREQADRLSGELAANRKLREENERMKERVVFCDWGVKVEGESYISERNFDKQHAMRVDAEADLATAKERIGELESGASMLRPWADGCDGCEFIGKQECSPHIGECHSACRPDQPATNPHCEGCGDSECRDLGGHDAVKRLHPDGIHWHCYQAPEPEMDPHCEGCGEYPCDGVPQQQSDWGYIGARHADGKHWCCYQAPEPTGSGIFSRAAEIRDGVEMDEVYGQKVSCLDCVSTRENCLAFKPLGKDRCSKFKADQPEAVETAGDAMGDYLMDGAFIVGNWHKREIADEHKLYGFLEALEQRIASLEDEDDTASAKEQDLIRQRIEELENE